MNENIERSCLPDTLGILNPEQTFAFCKKIVESTLLHFDFHAHNDYDLAVANVFSAVKQALKEFIQQLTGPLVNDRQCSSLKRYWCFARYA